MNAMSRLKVILLVLVVVLSVGILAGCGPAKLVDGVYKVEAATYDTHGFKPQLEVTVASGKVTAVFYEEVDKNGLLKSADEKYAEEMKDVNGTYPSKAYQELEDRLIAKQTATIDVVAGATTSSKDFKTLAKHVMEKMAVKGDTTPAVVPIA